MTDRPCLMSAPMVRACIREVEQPGTGKTNTRRYAWRGPKPTIWQSVQPGDQLWVREAFKQIASGEVKNGYGEVRYGVGYRADGATVWNSFATKIWDLTGQPPSGPMQFADVPWKPGIHMPRRLSRLTLLVEAVRVERLQDISEEDAKAEGIALFDDGWHWERNPDPPWARLIGRTPQLAFAGLWDEVHGDGAWSANSWVSVVVFRPVLANIDALPAAGRDALRQDEP
jgi:hypothetical protein